MFIYLHFSFLIYLILCYNLQAPKMFVLFTIFTLNRRALSCISILLASGSHLNRFFVVAVEHRSLKDECLKGLYELLIRRKCLDIVILP